MFKESKIIPILSYIYIVLPILIFIIGWCKPWIAFIGTLIILVSLYYGCKNAPKLWFPKDTKGTWFLVGLFIISLAWVYFSGIGALVYQNLDHSCRNPIFDLLVNNNWPVIVQDKVYLGVDKPLILTYYIAFWLPSAIIGKIFHSVQLGYYAQILWASIGIFCTFYYIMTFLKYKNYLPIFLFIFFSGLDTVGANITKTVPVYDITSHLEWWFSEKQFSSFTTQLFWVFNQAIPAWLLTLVLLKEKNNSNIMFYYSALLLYSTLPAIGILPLVIYLMFLNGKEPCKSCFKLQNLKECLKNACTIQNILGTSVITIISYSYLSNNLSGGTFTLWYPNIYLIIGYILFFLFLEVGIFIFIIFSYYKKEPLLYIISLMFIIYPFLGIGSSYDFCMRGTIPALVILYLLVVKVIDSRDILRNKFAAFVLVIALLLGSITPIHEFARTIYYTNLGYGKIYPNLKGTNFFAYVDGNTFLKYFGKATDK